METGILRVQQNMSHSGVFVINQDIHMQDVCWNEKAQPT